MFLVRLFDDRSKSIRKFEPVKLRYSMLDSADQIIFGIVFDTYLLNQAKWAKVLQLSIEVEKNSRLERNVAYVLPDDAETAEIEQRLRIDTFVGVVVEGSTIGKLKFEYSKKKDNLQEGDLVELLIGGTRLFYQIVSGATVNELLEAKNETGFIEGEAVQLREWNEEHLAFRKFGWVPQINTPIFLADTDSYILPSIPYPEFRLGTIPGTRFPSVINLAEAVSHHLALIGITGSGKSFLAKEIITALNSDTKVICVDFTSEWKKKLAVHDLLGARDVKTFLGSGPGKIGIFELPALSNTSDVIKETQQFVDTVFTFAKQKYDEGAPIKIALVLEEAHTITPETGFLGDLVSRANHVA